MEPRRSCKGLIDLLPGRCGHFAAIAKVLISVSGQEVEGKVDLKKRGSRDEDIMRMTVLTETGKSEGVLFKCFHCLCDGNSLVLAATMENRV